MKKMSIRKKISSLTVRISLISVIIIGAIAVAGLLILRANTVKISGELGETAAADSRNALESQMTDRLMMLAANKASLSDSTLKLIQSSVEMIAAEAQQIEQNPERYKPNPVDSPSADNNGIMAAQFLWAENAEPSVYSENASLMGNIEGLLKSIIDNNINAASDFNAVINYIGSEHGYIIIVDDASGTKSEFFDPRERPWYKLAAGNDSLSWTDVYSDAYGRGLAITCAKPYYDNDGKIAGVAGVGTILTELTEIVVGTNVGETGYAFMLNEQGQIIISSELKVDENGNIIREDLLNSENQNLAETVQKIISGKNGIERIEMDGKEYFMAYAKLETLPWSLVTVIEVDEAIKPATESEENIIDMKNKALGDINIIIIIVIISFFIIIAISILMVGYSSERFANTLTKPITVLQEGVHEIADGNLEHIINVHTGDEIEDLGLSVNKMAHDLKEYIANLQLVTADKERIGAELNVATNIQVSMLPCIFPAFPERQEFDIYATMLPAKEVGGDFYDFFLVDDNTLAVVMADVSGKGVPAALFMVIAKTLIKNNAQSPSKGGTGKSPKEVFETVNNILCENNDESMFVTAFMGYLDLKTGRFTYVNAGHNTPVLRRNNSECEWLSMQTGFVLAGLEEMSYEQSSIDLRNGDMLYLYTDGVTEAVNPAYELFSDERLLSVCEKYKDLNPHKLLPEVKKEIDLFASGAEQADDITMLSLLIREIGSNGGVEEKKDFELTARAKTEELENVLKFISNAIDNYRPDCSEEIRNNIAITTEEVFVNIAHYAYEADNEGNAVIRINTSDGFSVEFEDSGKPYNPLNKPDPDITLPAEEREIGGLGIFMVKEMMDKVEYKYENGKNKFIMMKRI